MNDRILERLRSYSPGSILAVDAFRGDLTVTVPAGDLVRVCKFLKNDPELAFDMLVDVCGIDRYRPEGRFEVVYNAYSTRNRVYLRLKVIVDENSPVVPTVCSVWSSANWYERETFDMFGVRFSGHPDLRRMYMPEEFEYHPLRKDFPVMGIPDSIPLPRR